MMSPWSARTTANFGSQSDPGRLQLNILVISVEKIAPISSHPSQQEKLKMEAHACKHFQIGFCKFGNRCRKHHIKEICQNENCKSKLCNMRHPKPCKYFKVHQSCKFGELCCYSHSIPTKQNDIAILVAKVDQMESTIKSMSEQIKLLEEEVNSNKNEQFSCEFCDYKASSTTVLKAVSYQSIREIII